VGSPGPLSPTSVVAYFLFFFFLSFYSFPRMESRQGKCLTKERVGKAGGTRQSRWILLRRSEMPRATPCPSLTAHLQSPAKGNNERGDFWTFTSRGSRNNSDSATLLESRCARECSRVRRCVNLIDDYTWLGTSDFEISLHLQTLPSDRSCSL
jgi:hypothetical protein